MVNDLEPPKAVFLDFGGVLTDVSRRDAGFADVAVHIFELLSNCGVSLELEDIEAHVRAGSRAFEQWKRSQSRLAAPMEPTASEFWEFVTSDWPRRARAAVDAHATALCERFEAATVARPAKPGAVELLQGLRQLGLRTALICNTLSGSGTRQLMRDHGFAGLLTLELYSDEQRLRKPNPGLFSLALTAFDLTPKEVWYVGDKLDRDVLAAKRAGLGGAILMAPQTLIDDDMPGLAPDLVVRNPRHLLKTIEAQLANG